METPNMILAMFAAATEPLVQKYSAKTEPLTVLAIVMAVITSITAMSAAATVHLAA